MGEKFSSFVSKFLSICLLIFGGLTVIGIVIYSLGLIKQQSIIFFVLFLAFSVFGFIIITGICYLLTKIPDSFVLNLLVLIGLLSFFGIIYVIWLYITPSVQYSDYGIFWRYGIKAINGNRIYHMDNNYFAKWAYQTGFLTYVMLIIKLFGAHIRYIQIFNVVYQLLILVLIYFITKKIFHKVSLSRCSVFLLGINIEWFAINNRVTNQYIGLVFILLTFLCILQDHCIGWIAGGLSLAIANYLRPLGVIYVVGIVAFGVVYRLINLPGHRLKSLLHIVTFVMSYFLLFSGLSFSVKQSGLNEYGLRNRDTTWKFVTGLNYQSEGTKRKFINNQFDLKSDRKTMQKEEKAFTRKNIRELNAKHLWIKLFIKKFNILWAYPSNSLDYTLFRKKYSLITYELLIVLSFAINSIEMFLLLFAAIAYARKQMTSGYYLLLLPLLVYTAAQLIIEVQGRYRIEFTPILVIISSLGIQLIITRMIERRAKKWQLKN